MKMHTTIDQAPTEGPTTPALTARDSVAKPQARKRVLGWVYQPVLNNHLRRDLGIDQFGFREVA